MSRPRASLSASTSEARQYDSEFISEDRPPLKLLRSKVMSRANFYRWHANMTPSQALKLSWAEWKQVKQPVHHNFEVLNHPQHIKPKKLFLIHKEPKPDVYGSRTIKSLTSAAILTCLTILTTIVISWGLFQNGPQIIPSYEVPHISVWDVDR